MTGSPFNILVIGAGGQVGSQLVQSLNLHPRFNTISGLHSDIDICRVDSIKKALNQSIDAVVNCAAYTAVDLAQSNPEPAWRVNALGPMLLAKACQNANIPLIHYSSDYVYHNGLFRPLLETDPCNPKSVYAISKYLGEQDALYHHSKTVVIRTSWVYADQGQNFVNTISRLSKEKSKIQVVNDQFGAPTYTPDLVSATIKVLEYIVNPSLTFDKYGIYNFANEGGISWYEFAKEIIRLLQSNCEVEPVPTAAFPRPAPRPPYSVFDLSSIKSTFDLTIPAWDLSLVHSIALKEQL